MKGESEKSHFHANEIRLDRTGSDYTYYILLNYIQLVSMNGN
jgi:hypothetical protein